uniref:Integrin alpha-2 domain-containing protein n=1 Tax=Plectus sambesii TaxID=2011161 RepID=A0A914VMX4_9BILA
MVSPMDGGGVGTGSDSGVTSPSPPSTSRQDGDERMGDPVDPHDVSVLPDQLPPPSDASTPLKVDCSRGAAHSASTEADQRSNKSTDDEDMDNELDMLAENRRLLQSQFELQCENNEYRTQIDLLHANMQQCEDRIASSEHTQQDLIERMRIEKEEADAALVHLQRQVEDGRKFIEMQLAEHEQDRADLEAENMQLAEHEQDRADLEAENVRLREALQKANEQLYASSLSTTDAGTTIRLDSSVTATQTDFDKDEQQAILDALKQKVSEQEQELIDQQRTVEQLQSALDEANERADGLTAELGAKSDDIAQLKESLENLQIAVGEHACQKKDLEDEKALLMDQVQQKTRELKIFERKNNELLFSRQQEDTLARQVEELNQALSNANALLKQKSGSINDVCAQLRSVKMERDKYKCEADHLRQTVNQMCSGEERDLRSHLEGVEAENRALQSQIDRMVGQLEAVKDVQKAFETQKTQIAERDRHVKDLEHTLDLTIREKEELAKQRQQLRDANSDWKQAYDRLECEYKCFKENAEIQYSTEKSNYERVIGEKDDRITYLYDRLATYDDYPGGIRSPNIAGRCPSAIDQTTNASLWDAIPADMRDALHALRVESQAVARIVRQMQSTTLVGDTVVGTTVQTTLLTPSTVDAAAGTSFSRESSLLSSLRDALQTRVMEEKCGVDSKAVAKQRLAIQRSLVAMIDRLLAYSTVDVQEHVKSFCDDVQLALSSFNQPLAPAKESTEDARRWQKECEQLKADRKADRREAEENCRSLREQLEHSDTAYQELKLMLDKCETELDTFCRQLKQLEKQLSDSRREVDRLNEEKNKLTRAASQLQSDLQDQKTSNDQYEEQAIATINSLQTAFEEERERAERLEESNRQLNRRVEELRRQAPDDSLLAQATHLVTRLTDDVADKTRELLMCERAIGKLSAKNIAWRRYMKHLEVEIRVYRQTEEMSKNRLAKLLNAGHPVSARLQRARVPVSPKRQWKRCGYAVIAFVRLLRFGQLSCDQENLRSVIDSRPSFAASSISRVNAKPLCSINSSLSHQPRSFRGGEKRSVMNGAIYLVWANTSRTCAPGGGILAEGVRGAFVSKSGCDCAPIAHKIAPCPAGDRVCRSAVIDLLPPSDRRPVGRGGQKRLVGVDADGRSDRARRRGTNFVMVGAVGALIPGSRGRLVAGCRRSRIRRLNCCARAAALYARGVSAVVCRIVVRYRRSIGVDSARFRATTHRRESFVTGACAMRRHLVTALLAALFAVAAAFNIDVKRAVVHRHTADTYFGYSIDIYQDKCPFEAFDVIEPVGTCYYARDSFNKIEEFAPCRQEPAKHGHHRFGYGMCGFSAAIPESKDDRLYIGAPGVYYWQGSLFVQNINEQEQRPNTPDGPAHTDHNMLGYSTATGDFDGDGVDDAAVGIPRGNDLLGLVALYSHKLRNLVNLTNEGGQRGSFFGASIAVTDVDGDGLDDVIVGVPFYTNYTSDKSQESKPKYDIGQVKVFLQGADHSFRTSKTVYGHTEWSRFGHAVAAAGDLNGDGYNDFIVGAPYDGQDGRGAVYVYHGAKDGIRTEYTQKIEAQEVDVDMRTFGFSLAGGKDVDGNGYPDVAVGAWQSNKAVMFKTKPVVSVTGYVRPKKATIDLNDKLCQTNTEFGYMACDEVKFCLKYEGKEAPNSLNLDLKVQVDSKKRLSPRAFFLQKDFRDRKDVRLPPGSPYPPDTILHRVTLTKGKELCEIHNFYVPDTIRDKLTPITISANYTYVGSSNGLTQSGQLEPALDTTVPQALTAEVDIQRNCGSDNECVPDLELAAKANKDTFTVGTVDNTLTLDVTVKNLNEDAYEAQFFIAIPKGFEYSGIENKGKVGT